ncbi:MAG: PQQ-binding-like beta-propeller repeat protein [Bacteroidales bacterium]|nr:PQQ-binding-like beta-propeller repeat protein [Bacteroidales bacterium]
MQKTEKTIIEITTIILMLGLTLIGCDKENMKDGNEVTKSDRQKYEFSVPGLGFSVGCPTLVNNFIYIGTSSNLSYPPSPTNYFYKLDATLNKVWEFPLSNKQLRGPASLDTYGNIYFVVDSGRTEAFGNTINKIYSLDNNGNYRWSKDIGSFDTEPCIKSIAIADDNTIYAGGDSLYAFDINGTVKWVYGDLNTLPGGIRSAIIIDPAGNLFFTDYTHVISLDKNGHERWTYITSDAGVSSPAFTKDYSNLIIAVGKEIYSIKTSGGNLDWKYPINMNADFRSTPAVDDNGVIYIGSHGFGLDNDESTLYAVKADGSGILWQNNLGSDIYSSPTLGNDRVIYLGSEGHGNTEDKHNRLHAFRMSNSERIWSAQLYNDVTWGSPILSDNGMLYVSSMYTHDGQFPSGVYAFQTDATGLLPNCGSSTFQLSNAHNGRR